MTTTLKELSTAQALTMYHSLREQLMTKQLEVGDPVEVYGWAARCTVRARITRISHLTAEVAVSNGGSTHFTTREYLAPLPADATCDIWFGGPESDGAGGERQCKRPAGHPHDAVRGARGNHAAAPLPQDAR